MCQPAVDIAVDNYMHRNEPDYFHKRYPPDQCPLCPTPMEALRGQLSDALDLEDLRENIAASLEGNG